MAGTKLSEAVDLKTLKFLFPNNWKDKLAELKKSKWESIICKGK